MIEVNKNRTKTDEAWERLYARLDEDNLLAGAGQGVRELVHVKKDRSAMILGGDVNC